MRKIAILTMAALLLTGCAAETSETAAEPELPETAVTESTRPSPTSEETDAVEDTQTTEEEDGPTEAQTQAGSGTASPTPTQSASPTPTQSASPSPTATQTAESGFTLAEVATRNTASECWVAISGNVYDLTRWIAQHPGGSSAIIQLCGTDGTQAFTSQHGGQSNPTSTLARYLIGPLR